MDALRPGHAHRSSSDRLLNNYLDSQKHLSTSLLTLLSHSHSSTSSLLAYVTSSPGVVQPVRRSVRHAAFEGPLSPSLVDNPETGSHTGPLDETQGWSAYISCLDQFRKDLKQIHLLEEELSRVKRDREILVSRLIKTTKSRPTKSDLSAIASQYRTEVQSSGASMSSWTSNGSSTTKEGKRAVKLADAQAELLGCEEHLRSLEVRIEHERNTVMLRGLEDRFRAMDAVARMWLSQAKRGLEDLEKINELPADAYELDSNPSLAPSQSASQIDYDENRSPQRGNVPFPKLGAHINGPGSITGSIVEEDEDSSGDEHQRKLIVHENRPASRATMTRAKTPTAKQPSPLGVASVTAPRRPLSSAYGTSQFNRGGGDSDSDAGNGRAGGRRAASDVGAMGYRPPTGRTPLRRTYSADRNKRGGSDAGRRGGSDTSSIRAKKKKGFFASISKFFKGPKKSEGSRSGRDSPAYGSSGNAWHTRTDSNLKRTSSMYGSKSRRRGGDDSSSDEDAGNLVSVSNNRTEGAWAVDNAGRAPSRNSIKRSSSTPVASGLIPQKPAGIKRNSSQSTITGRTTPAPSRSNAATPVPSSKPTANGSLSRSGTVKSSMSTASAKTAGTTKTAATAKSGGTVKSKTRLNGSIAKSASVGSQQAVEGRNIMALVDLKAPPAMPEVPKAPKSHVTPSMELPKAPGSSIVPPEAVSVPKMDEPPKAAVSRSGSVKKVQENGQPPRSSTPLPPSRTLHPPAKSALRPSSPTPASGPRDVPSLGQAIFDAPPSKPLYTISAPGPVELPKAEPAPVSIPAPAVRPAPPPTNKRNSYHSMTSGDGNSIYESAVEDESGAGPNGNDTSDSDDDMPAGYHFVENERVKRLGINVGPPAVERISSHDHSGQDDYVPEDEGSDTSVDTATHRTQTRGLTVPKPVPSDARSSTGSTLSKRKSVRMAVPDSPAIETAHAPAPVTDPEQKATSWTSPANDRAPSPPPRERSEDWSTRIGSRRSDTSDESDHDEDYLAARKGLIRNSGKFESVVEDGKKKIKRKSGSVGGSTKKGNSIKRSVSRG